MKVVYNTKEIARICTEPDYAKRRYPQIVVEKLQILLTIIEHVDNLMVFNTSPALTKYHLEWLQGKKRDVMSLRIDKSYRLEFASITGERSYIKIEGIEIKELSNHYGD